MSRGRNLEMQPDSTAVGHPEVSVPVLVGLSWQLYIWAEKQETSVLGAACCPKPFIWVWREAALLSVWKLTSSALPSTDKRSNCHSPLKIAFLLFLDYESNMGSFYFANTEMYEEQKKDAYNAPSRKKTTENILVFIFFQTSFSVCR